MAMSEALRNTKYTTPLHHPALLVLLPVLYTMAMSEALRNTKYTTPLQTNRTALCCCLDDQTMLQHVQLTPTLTVVASQGTNQYIL
jgi:hypothetical protein